MRRRIGFYPESGDLNQVIEDLTEENRIAVFNAVLYEPLRVDHYELEIEASRFRCPSQLKPAELIARLSSPFFSSTQKEALGLCSRVTLESGQQAHIRQLDLDIGRDRLIHADSLVEEALPLIRRALTTLHGKKEAFEGYVVFSGVGYHYYDLGVVDESRWKAWIDRAETSDEVDSDWCGISQITGFSVLRISPAESKPYRPKLMYSVRRKRI